MSDLRRELNRVKQENFVYHQKQKDEAELKQRLEVSYMRI